MTLKDFVARYQRNASIAGMAVGVLFGSEYRFIDWLSPHLGWFGALAAVSGMLGMMAYPIGALVDRLLPLPAKESLGPELAQ
jgi:hypothetical protein